MNQPINSFAVDKPMPNQPIPINQAMGSLTPEQQKMLKNLLDSFISGGQGREFDLSKPPVEPYRFRAFPMMVYHHTSGHVVTIGDAKQLQSALEQGFSQDPSPNHDYGNVRNGVAAPRHAAAAQPQRITAADLVDGPSDEELAKQFEAGSEEMISGEQVNEAAEPPAPSRRRR